MSSTKNFLSNWLFNCSLCWDACFLLEKSRDGLKLLQWDWCRASTDSSLIESCLCSNVGLLCQPKVSCIFHIVNVHWTVGFTICIKLNMTETKQTTSRVRNEMMYSAFFLGLVFWLFALQAINCTKHPVLLSISLWIHFRDGRVEIISFGSIANRQSSNKIFLFS